MNQDIKVKWLEALASGKYHHGKGYLKFFSDDDGATKHCCLGVLCELAALDGVIEPARTHQQLGIFRFGGSEVMLPSAVNVWASVSADQAKELAGLNDSIATENYVPVIDMIQAYL